MNTVVRKDSRRSGAVRFIASAPTIVLTTAMLAAVVAPTAPAQTAKPATAPLTPTAMAIHIKAKRPLSFTNAKIDVSSADDSSFNSEQGPGPGPRDLGQPGCDLFPAPASVGTNVGLSYFGPSPSTVNPSLVGPVQLLKTGQVDAVASTITIPLYKGKVKSTGKTAWYILTDVSHPGIAQESGLNYSAKLNFINAAARTGNLGANGNIVFERATVNFAPRHNLVPGPEGAEFPPHSFAPGEVGDKDYSPFVTITNAQGVV